ncbi:alpha/beta hydrolase, partial [Clostridium sp. Cult1]
IINSRADEITPYFMGQDIYNSVKHNNKKIFTVEYSAHAEIYFDYPNEYEANVLEFIKDLN